MEHIKARVENIDGGTILASAGLIGLLAIGAYLFIAIFLPSFG